MQRSFHARRSAMATILLLGAVCLLLAACGSSSSSSSTAATSSTSAAGGPPAGGGRFAALRTCLAQQGIKLAPRTPGQRPPTAATGGGGVFGGGGGARGGLRPPAGVSTQQFQAALKKCGGGARPNNRAFNAALVKFASCMRSNGVNLPPPNTSGTGPVFSTKGLNTTSATFRAADAKCAPNLGGRFGRATGGPSAASS